MGIHCEPDANHEALRDLVRAQEAAKKDQLVARSCLSKFLRWATARCGVERTLQRNSKAIAWKAQHRLYHRYPHLLARGKTRQKVVTAVARELLGIMR